MFKPKMKEVTGPEQKKLETGETCGGIFVAIDQRVIEGKTVQVYTFSELNDNGKPTGADFELLETADLRKKLKPVFVGHYVEVTKTPESISTNNGKMAVYRVAVSQESVGAGL